MTPRETFAAAVSGTLTFRAGRDTGAVTDEDVAAIIAAGDAYRASALREMAAEIDQVATAATLPATGRLLSEVAQLTRMRAEAAP